MASKPKVLKQQEGVRLVEIGTSLDPDGSPSARLYSVQSMRSPLAFPAENLRQARQIFDDEVARIENGL